MFLVKLGECLQCYKHKKSVTSSKIENIPIGECIHCHPNKPVKLGECLQCYQQKISVALSKIENNPIGKCIHCHQNHKPIENNPIGKCIYCHQNKLVRLGECLQCYQHFQCYQQEKTLVPLEQINNNKATLAPDVQLENHFFRTSFEN
ncbi:unnamed protein product [Rhizophagus irregularis]|nr:unnamed protein product [Rhizophagus irregularis]